MRRKPETMLNSGWAPATSAVHAPCAPRMASSRTVGVPASMARRNRRWRSRSPSHVTVRPSSAVGGGQSGRRCVSGQITRGRVRANRKRRDSRSRRQSPPAKPQDCRANVMRHPAGRSVLPAALTEAADCPPCRSASSRPDDPQSVSPVMSPVLLSSISGSIVAFHS